jgi:hydroxymethylglutaryl-CoA synthase
MVKVGIDAIAFYTPNYCLDLNILAENYSIDVNKFYIGLGQKKISIPPPDEDIVTMALEAASKVLEHVDKNEIDFLIFATETSIDQSKSAGIYVHKLLDLPSRCRNIEIKQACYSGTAGLQIALSMIASNSSKKILLITSDIARYGIGTSGESSQGSGAVAMIISKNPRIISIEPESGFYTEDSMDFWRPNYLKDAIVDGKYSCKLYIDLAIKTWKQYLELSKRNFDDHAYFCYHTAIPRLVEKTHQALREFSNLPLLSKTELEIDLGASLKYSRITGNCYTASLYLSLVSLLDNVDNNIEGKYIGFYSYGSGSVAEFFSGIIQENYLSLLSKDYHKKMLDTRIELSKDEYENFYRFQYNMDSGNIIIPKYKNSNYRLEAIVEHKRIYTKSIL